MSYMPKLNVNLGSLKISLKTDVRHFEGLERCFGIVFPSLDCTCQIYSCVSDIKVKHFCNAVNVTGLVVRSLPMIAEHD